MFTARRAVTAVIVCAALFHLSPGGTFAQAKRAVPAERKVKDFVGKADQKRDRQGMYNFESGAYRITTDVDKDLANDIAAHMDEVYKEYASGLSHFRPNPYAAVKPTERMPLYVLRRYKDYLALLEGFGVNAANSGGVFFRTENRQSGLATWVEGQSRLKMYYILQHEGFHQFADARIMFGLPPWVNEGLAEYFGDAVMVDRKLQFGRLDRERIERMRRAVKNDDTLPFAKLMQMNNDAWLERVTGGDKGAGLMYDQAWSVCYFLLHGGKAGKPLRTKARGADVGALEAYLRILNDSFVRNPQADPRPAAFKEVFSNNLKNFEAAWKEGLQKLEPDPWFSSVRHAQFIGAGLKLLHGKQVEVKDWAEAKEKLGAIKFRMVPRERDAAAAPRGDRKPQMEEVQTGYDFPAPAEAELVPSDDPKLPPGLRVTNVTPNIVLGWETDAEGEVAEDIRFVDPPRQPKKPASTVAKPADARPAPRP